MMEPLVEAMAKNNQLTDMLMTVQPGMKKVLEKNPEVSKTLKDPETMKEMLMSQLNPDKRREMSRTLNLQMAQISAIPGGEQMLENQMYRVNRQLDSAVTRTECDLHTTSAEAVQPREDRTANKDAIPDPWSTPAAEANANGWNPMPFGPPPVPGQGGQTNTFNPFLNFGANGAPPWNWGMPADGWQAQGPATGVPPPSAAVVSSTQKVLSEAVRQELLHTYDKELSTLAEMGFEDRNQCLEALYASNGDVEAAVEYIADRQNE
ncbi:hypothetical protein STCU_09746 [Strigomonas culicis]|uniref:UBA domain-containing protein n=1 Tax=Strigomonas culicis TaxID=28005 RepID=S9UWC8_9TRYP|nr:hypothetical protein STCU_09746 [Strigomonas culicis]|eukprot:EPY18846.1 hypothetical protein STCU_09746 [Strigomonas culicis]